MASNRPPKYPYFIDGGIPDLTIIFLTVNLVPEGWAKFHRQTVEEAIGDTQVISVTAKPSDWGTNLIQDNIGYSNIYEQIYRAAQLATTPYIAVVEDDTLYPREHFTTFRPELDTFAYNMTRWGIFTWGVPYYFHKHRIANSTLIAPRLQLLKAQEERMSKFPAGIPDRFVGEYGRGRIEMGMRVTNQKQVEFWTTPGVVCFNHDYSLDHLERSHRKAPWFVQAYDIPQWGHAKELREKFK